MRIILIMRIADSSPPLTRRTSNPTVSNNLHTASSVTGLVKAPNVVLAALLTIIMPAHRVGGAGLPERAIYAMNKPLPATIACLSDSGSALTKRSRNPLTHSPMNNNPCSSVPNLMALSQSALGDRFEIGNH